MPRSVIIVATMLFILLMALASAFMREGFTHVLPSSMLRWSGDLWQRGMYAESVSWFVRSHEDALDAGVRWWAAKPYLDRTRVLAGLGRPQAALDNCIHAVALLDGHDDEGQVSYLCATLELSMNAQK